jgi:hypothetical protein
MIDPEGDLTIRLYQTLKTGPTFISASGNMMSGHILSTMKLSRQILIDNSSQFNRMLSGDFKEARRRRYHRGHCSQLRALVQSSA